VEEAEGVSGWVREPLDWVAGWHLELKGEHVIHDHGLAKIGTGDELRLLSSCCCSIHQHLIAQLGSDISGFACFENVDD
jgi:hypothetical protein